MISGHTYILGNKNHIRTSPSVSVKTDLEISSYYCTSTSGTGTTNSSYSCENKKQGVFVPSEFT